MFLCEMKTGCLVFLQNGSFAEKCLCIAFAKSAPPVGYNTLKVLDHHTPIGPPHMQMTPFMNNIAFPVGYNGMAVIDVDHTYVKDGATHVRKESVQAFNQLFKDV